MPFYPSLGISTMPTISITGFNEIFLTFCPTMETYDNGSQHYQHLIADLHIMGEIHGVNLMTY